MGATSGLSTDPLRELGWDAGWAAAFAEAAGEGQVPARVLADHGEQWPLALAGGEAMGIPSGRFRFSVAGPGDLPAAGDWLAVDPPAGLGSPAIIQAVLPRRTAFRRFASDMARRGGGRLVDEQVLAANVDVACLVAGLDLDFDLRRIERYLAVTYAGGVRPVIVLNKADVDPDLTAHQAAVAGIAPGVPVHVVSAITGQGVPELAAAHLGPGRTVVLLGSSGVGKSTLTNALLGRVRQATGPVRAHDSRGRHVTTVRELVRLPGGALLIDTPGLRTLKVYGADAGIGATFDDVRTLAEACRFADCRHEHEPGCAVLAAVADGRLAEDRFAGWRKLERELAHAGRLVDPVARAADRRRWKAIQKSVDVHMKHKYGGS